MLSGMIVYHATVTAADDYLERRAPHRQAHIERVTGLRAQGLLRAGFDPITEPAGAIDWDTLKDRFLGSRERCLMAISRLSDESLAETVPHPFGGTCSRAELLNTLAFHQTYHTGQLAIARRIAGLEGAVKAPGQAQAQKV